MLIPYRTNQGGRAPRIENPIDISGKYHPTLYVSTKSYSFIIITHPNKFARPKPIFLNMRLTKHSTQARDTMLNSLNSRNSPHMLATLPNISCRRSSTLTPSAFKMHSICGTITKAHFLIALATQAIGAMFTMAAPKSETEKMLSSKKKHNQLHWDKIFLKCFNLILYTYTTAYEVTHS